MPDLVQRLREDVLTQAVADERLTDERLAHRLRQERQEAANEIEKLREGLRLARIGIKAAVDEIDRQVDEKKTAGPLKQTPLG